MLDVGLVYLVSFLGVILLTFAIRRISVLKNIVDSPDGKLKMQPRPVALLGGVSIFVVFWVATFYFIFLRPILGIDRIANGLGALFYGSLLLFLVGVSDELRPMSPKIRLFLLILVLASVAVIMPITKITNPAGGFFILPEVVGALLVYVWLFMTTTSIKLLDGVDGLATSVVLVGSVLICALTLSNNYYQPNVALVAGLFCVVLVGFLGFNFPPAKIYLGESGSLFLGFMVGGLAILSGSKIATALLVMTVPILDVVRVIIIRLKNGRPVMLGDRNHLHFILIDRGWSSLQVLLFFLSISILFGLIGLYLQRIEKLLALLLVCISFVIFSWSVTISKNKTSIL